MKKRLYPYLEPFIVILITFVIQNLIYQGSQLINSHFDAHDWTIPFIDDNIPFVPIFIIIYVTCYFWWYLTPLAVARKDLTKFYDYIVASIIGYGIHLVFYVVTPTTITRPLVEGTDIFSQLVKFIYQCDSPERAINLFPSMHCFISAILALTIMDTKDINKGFKWFSYIYGILVCISTVLVKQHYFIDIIGGVVIAGGCFMITKKLNLGRKIKEKIHDHQTI